MCVHTPGLGLPHDVQNFSVAPKALPHTQLLDGIMPTVGVPQDVQNLAPEYMHMYVHMYMWMCGCVGRHHANRLSAAGCTELGP